MRRLIVGAFASLLPLTLPASADERGWYFGAEGGLEFDGGNVGAYLGGGDSGVALLATFGTKISKSVAFEGELGYRSVDFPSFFGPTDVTQVSFLINATYEAPLSDQFSVEAGLGLGFDYIDAADDFFSDTDTALASQLLIGANYAIGDGTDLTLKYRYMRAFSDFYLDDGNQGLRNSTLTLGLRFDL